MPRNVTMGAEQGEQDDRRMNAYMAGIQPTYTHNREEGEEVDEDEVEAAHFRRQRRRARKAEY